MSVYSNGPPAASSPASPPPTFTGQYVSKAHLTRRQRAQLAADLTTGAAVLYPLTCKQAGFVLRVPVLDVTKERQHNGKSGNGQPAVEDYTIHETTDRDPASDPTIHCDPTYIRSLVEGLRGATPLERTEIARVLGFDFVWDELILPVMQSERNGNGS
jgi:hypothetical protein